MKWTKDPKGAWISGDFKIEVSSETAAGRPDGWSLSHKGILVTCGVRGRSFVRRFDRIKDARKHAARIAKDSNHVEGDLNMNAPAPSDFPAESIAYVVEASSAEQSMLWAEWSDDACRNGWGTTKNKRVPWEQIHHGWSIQVGLLAGYPIVMALTLAKINEQTILFWEAVSQVVDHAVCESWLRERVPAYARRDACDAANFGHCLARISK
jgi:hypothetical protein